MRQPRVGNALQITRAAGRHRACLEYGHGDTARRERRRYMRAGQSGAHDQGVIHAHGVGIEVPRRQSRRARRCGVEVATQGLALAAVARSFGHMKAGVCKPASDRARRGEGGEGGAGSAETRHRLVNRGLPGTGFGGRGEAIEVPSVDPRASVAGQILEDLCSLAPPKVDRNAPVDKAPPVAAG